MVIVPRGPVLRLFLILTVVVATAVAVVEMLTAVPGVGLRRDRRVTGAPGTEAS